MSRRRGPLGRALKNLRMAVKNPVIEGLCALAAAGLDRRVRAAADLAAEPPRRILVIRTDRIGDLLCGTPLIAALRHRWPDSPITLVGGPRNRGVMPLIPYVTRAPVEFARDPLSWARLRAWLPRQGFDCAVSLRSEVMSGALIAGWSRARVRAAVHAVRTLPAFNLVLAPHERHQVRRYWLAATGLGVTWPEVRPVIEIPAEHDARGRAVVEGLGLPDGRPLVGVGVPNRADGKHRIKAWPPATLEAFVRALSDAGARVLLFGVGAERVEAGRIAARVPGVAVSPALPLASVAAVQKRLDLFVASFTGTLHLADGAGTATVAIGLPGQCADWRPLGPRHRALAAPRVPDIPVAAALAACREALGGRLVGGAGLPGPAARG